MMPSAASPFRHAALAAVACLLATPAGARREGSGIGLRLSAGLPYHVESHEDYPKPGSQVSSVGYYFEEAFSGQLQAYFAFPPNARGVSVQALGLWGYRNLQGRDRAEEILGEELRVVTWGGGLGVTRAFGGWNRGFLTLAYTWNSPRGEADLDDLRLTMDYKPTSGVQASAGWEARLFGAVGPMLGVGLRYDYLVLDRGEVKVYGESGYLGRFLPAGDDLLPDYCVTLFLSLGYGFGLD